MSGEFENLASSFIDRKVLVVGDLILDINHKGATLGLSAETPTLIVREIESRQSYGGAGLVVRNILALGGKVAFLTLVGSDDYSRFITAFFHPNLKKIFIRETSRKNIVKERFWAAGYKLLGWDHLDNHPINRKTENKIIALVKRNLPDFDKLIISDYRHGLLSRPLIESLVKIASIFKKPVYVDSQISQREGNHLWYKGTTLICVNRREAMNIYPDFNFHSLKSSLLEISKIMRSPNVILKLGENGSAALINGKYVSVKPHQVTAIDTSGAGDAFFAVLSLSPNPPSPKDLKFANTWAALSTTTIGANPPSISMLKKYND